MASSSTRDRSAAAGPSIAGGYVLVPVAALLGAWRACRGRPLGIGDFRAWLACREMVARRCLAGEDGPSTFTFAELARLMGVARRRARASVKRLVDAGLLDWSGSAIAFPDPPGGASDLVDTIGRGRGALAIPRRILRVLAGGARPALIATALGVLLRCLSRRSGGFDGRGRVKASWIASAFAVDLRRVKAARLELVALGWIGPEPSDQRAENRWGRAYRIDLDWDRVGSTGRRLPPLPDAPACPPLPPPLDADRPPIATPSVDQEPLVERQIHQEPADGGPAGVRPKGTGEANKPLPSPTLLDVRPEDLRDVERTLALFDQAIARKLVGPSEADRLKFLAIAEHARVVGTVNPGGLFARLVGRGLWHFATQDDEDAARRRLREHLYERDRPKFPDRPAARASSFVPDVPPGGPSTLSALLERFKSLRPES